MSSKRHSEWSLASEFQGVDLGDKRRAKRLIQIAERMEQAPDAGFPTMMGSESELEGCYRFLNNPHFSEYDLLEPHIEQTAQRAEAEDRLLAVHDQTPFVFDFDDQQEAVGELNTSERGFYGQFSLLVGGQARRRPLGVSAMSTIFRDGDDETPGRKLSGADYIDKQDRESEWWMGHVRWTEGLLAESDTQIVHVGDAAFDSYERIGLIEQMGGQFVTRARRRKARAKDTGKREWLTDHAETIEPIVDKKITLSRRQAFSSPKRREKYPARQGRKAQIQMGAKQVEFQRPNYLPESFPETVDVTLVYVWEPNPPEDEEPIEWLLVTNQPVGESRPKADDIQRVVDDYRARWRIESYFKALKTGCKYRERQLENRGSLLKALALSIPMAWQLMAMRDWAREHPEQPATSFFDEQTLQVLGHFAAREVPDEPTLKEVTMAVAGLGGHLRSNGPPGWQTLQRGLSKLHRLAEGWQAALEKCDQ